jgi:hypothetical protein
MRFLDLDVILGHFHRRHTVCLWIGPQRHPATEVCIEPGHDHESWTQPSPER